MSVRLQAGRSSGRFAGVVLRACSLLVLAALLAACGSREPGQARLPALAGRLIFETHNTYDDEDRRLWQAIPQTGEQAAQEVAAGSLTLRPQPDAAQCLDQARGVFCMGSPAGPYTLVAVGPRWRQNDWSAGTQGFLADRDTGAELDPSDTTCKAVWRPDGQKAAVVASGSLYVTGTGLAAERVLEGTREFYTEEGASSPLSTSQYVMVGAISCPVWITPDDLLVSRYTGGFPETVEMVRPVAGQGVAVHGTPDTTSVVHLSDSGPVVRDLPGLWKAEAVDPYGRLAVVSLLRAEGAMQPGFYLADAALLAAGQSQELVALPDCGPTSCTRFAFAPDGRQVAFSRDRGAGGAIDDRIEVWDREAGTFKSASPRPEAWPWGLVWSPRSDALAVSYDSPPEVYVWVADEERLAHLQIAFPSREGLFFELAGWVEP